MMVFFNGKKKSKWLLATILAITLIATYAVPMSVFADEPGQEQIIQLDSPVDPQDPPVDPQDPPVDPQDPPVDPQDPPVDPQDPPAAPEEPVQLQSVETATQDVTYGITLDKLVSVDRANAGDTITYTFVVKNTGTGTLEDVELEDPLFSDVWGRDNDLDLGDMAGGAVVSKTAIYTIPINFRDHELKNTATVKGYFKVYQNRSVEDVETSVNGKREKVSATDSVTIPVTPKHDIKLDKTADVKTSTIGGKIIYTFTVTNTGSETLKNVTVTDMLLGDFPEPWKWNIGELAGDATVTTTAAYTVPDPGFYISHSYNLKNWAVATGEYYPMNASEISTTSEDVSVNSRPRTVCDEDTATVTINPLPKYAIDLTKTGSVNVAAPGEKVTYTFTIKNTGYYDLYDVLLTDSKLGSEWSKSYSTLKRGATITVTSDEITLPDEFPYVNTATVVAYCHPQIQTPSVECVHECSVYSDTATFTIEKKPEVPLIYGITLEKTVSPSAVAPGETVQYTFKIKNTGTGTLGSVILTDPLFGTENYFLAQIGGDFMLEPGEEDTFVKDYVVPADYPGTELTNTATVTGFKREPSEFLMEVVFDWINGELSEEDSQTYTWFEENGVQATDSAIVTVDQGNDDDNTTNRTRRTATTTIPEPAVPESPAETPEISVIQDEIPAAPLPATGGVAPYLLYGLGLLLAGGGVTLKARNKKDKAE